MKQILFTIVSFLAVTVNSYIPIFTSLHKSNTYRLRENRLQSQFRSNDIFEYPLLNYDNLTEQNKYDISWFVVGKTSDFTRNKPQKVRVWNTNYVVWRKDDNTFFGLHDVCPHKGASLSGGKVCNNHIVCPYHGYEFDETGILTKVPGISFQNSPIHNVPQYTVVEKMGWVYLNTMQIADNTTYVENIFVEPEAMRNRPMIQLEMDYNCYARILSENSLDIMHIAFVHTFGNAKRPSPYKEDPPKKVGINHYKTTYWYESGEDSISRKIFGEKDLVIENEFILPHTTIARIIFGNYVSTVITFALPIGENKSRLFVKTYRNFWKNVMGDAFTRDSMYSTMLQDREVVENIDPEFMEGKFNMKFDKLQNVYKTFYKKWVHNSKN